MPDFYAAIFGAGISGTAIANALLNKGKEVLLIDPYVSEHAPGPPGALVNPATGRHARLSWKSSECLDALNRQVGELTQASEGEDLVSKSGVLRPALTEHLAENFRESLENYDWPEGWIRWVNPDEVLEINPDVGPNVGGLFLECGFTVYVDRYLNHYRRYLRQKGAECRYMPADYRFESGGRKVSIQFENQGSVTAEYLIIAAGHHTPGFDEWSELKLNRVKGQIVHYEADVEPEWHHAISAMGYIVRRGKRDLIAGSTYEHTFEGLETTKKAYEQIHDKFSGMLPRIAKKARKKGQFAGVRVTTPNNLPVIGRHHEIENLCIYTGLGSKGLLFSEYVASLLAGHLVHQSDIPAELGTARFHL